MSNGVTTAMLGIPLEVQETLKKLLGDALQPVLVRSDARDALPMLIPARPQAVLLYVGRDHAVPLQIARRIRHDLPSTSLMVLTSSEDVTLTREVMRLGARNLVVLGQDDAEIISAYQAMLKEPWASSGDGIVVALLGAKGGMGTTSLAINLAGLLAQDPANRVALVDLALYIGEVGVYLDMKTPYSLRDLMMNLDNLDEEYIRTNIPHHRTGFAVLSQPAEFDDADSVKVPDVVQAIGLLRRHFTHIVVDAGAQLSDVGLAGVHVADRTLIVLTQELPAIVSSRRRVNLLTQLSGTQTRIRMVCNRWNPSSNYDKARIEAYAKHGVNATVGNDYKNLSACIDQGKLLCELAPEAPITREIAALIPLFDDNYSPKDAGPKKGKLFGWF